MTWVRDIRRDSATVDADGSGTASIGYLFSSGAYVDPAFIANTPHLVLGGDTGLEPLPMKGSSHPTIPSFKLDAYTSQCDGKTQQVTANYSNDGRFRFPTDIDDDRRTNTHYSWQPTEVQIYYPWAERTFVGEAVPPGYVGPITRTPHLLVHPADYYINTTMPTWTWEVLIKEDERPIAEAAMLAQVDRIHQIGGKYSRFRAGGLEFYGVVDGARKYVARYMWVDDAGSGDSPLSPMFPFVATSSGQDKYFPQPSVPIGQTFASGLPMTRFPHHTVKHVETVQGPNGPVPVFAQQLDFRINLLGWQTLVGL